MEIRGYGRLANLDAISTHSEFRPKTCMKTWSSCERSKPETQATTVDDVDSQHPRNIVGAMSLADFPELKRLSRPARLRLAAELWDSAVSDALPVPASHKSLLRARRVHCDKGEMATLTITELKRSLRRRS